MSHELEFVNGEAQVMLRKDAWHQLGMVVGESFTWLDAVAQDLSITWPVEKVDLATLVDDEITFSDPQYVALRSDAKILASGIGETWASFSPEIAYDFVTYLRDEYGMEANLDSLGTIRGGKQWFMSFARGSFKIGDFDVQSHLTASGSYDQSWKFLTQAHETVAVCANTITAVRQAGQQLYTFKNTSGIFDRVEEAKQVVQIQRDREIGFQAMGERLLAVEVGLTDFKAFMGELLPNDENTPTKTRNAHHAAASEISALFHGETFTDLTASAAGTGWAFVQSVNTFENWNAPIRKTGGYGEESTRAFRQMDAVVSGRQPLTDKALELVLA